MTYHRAQQRPPVRGGQFQRQPPEFPHGYLSNGYFDNSGNILPQVIVDWPRDIAKKLEMVGLQVSQLRKFFAEARKIETQLNAGKEFNSIRGQILKFAPYAADAIKRDNAPLFFRRFIEENLKWASKDKKNFVEGFVQHFESVVAYFPKK